ncbi:MAG: hypothetical protein K2K53_03535 [Oscillospiraceae bacterium]|nr:hypothetical protein [Oscillospiraceae bacterium]
MIVFQLVLFCLFYMGLVKLYVGNNAVNGLYFYPKPVQERAIALGLTDAETMDRKRKQFLCGFSIAILAVLILIIGGWNGARDFKTAYLQALLFLEVVNWFDGIVIDRLWVGHSKFWVIPGTEDIPFVKPWKAVLTKRGLAMLAWAVIAAVVAELVILIF